MEETRKMAIGDQVTMVGRSSRSSHGTVSGIKSDVMLPEVEGFTTEYVVSGRDGQEFAAPGDSGGWVLDGRSNALVGMLFGGPGRRGGAAGGAYVTPIGGIVAHLGGSQFGVAR